MSTLKGLIRYLTSDRESLSGSLINSFQGVLDYQQVKKMPTLPEATESIRISLNLYSK